MPQILGHSTGPILPPQPPGYVVIPDEAPHVEYWGPDGSVTVLTDPGNGVILMPGFVGFGMPIYSLLTTDVPSRDGSILRGVRANARDMTVPLYFEGSSRFELNQKMRLLATRLDPRAGSGWLVVTERNGQERKICVYYSGGMEGDQGQDASGLHWETHGLSFKALEPFWLDLVDQTERWTIASTGNFFPILPLNLATGLVLGAQDIFNPGDEWSYPIWTITGPATSVTLTNTTTGKVLAITLTLASSSNTITIDTRPGVNTIVDETSANLWQYVGSNPQLWPLVGGDNLVNLAVGGATTGTSVSVRYTPRYKTA